MNYKTQLALALVFLLADAQIVAAQPPEIDTTRGDRMIAAYFRDETARLRDACLADIKTLDDWKSRRESYRRQLLDMLGLDPLPERTDLKAAVTGVTQHDEFIVEKLHFQSQPGLYVTGNLYLPRSVEKPLPAILYVCGHGRVKKDGVSYGNKVHYQHHGAWFARNGYVCLTIDTLQLGEIEGIHHGTYRENMWWWINRGYTPAGVEAWNCVRALDYLQSREEVDPDRIGVTGRSGGGAYSWWIAAIDERIKAAVPVAGITDLQNHVVAGMPGRFHDGCVEGHCDCMFMLNTYRWDYPQVAALVAPRPLLISNTDKDPIFPLDGVQRLHEKVRDIYRLYGQENQLGLHITEGPHQDTQELRVHAFRWFNRFLKNDDSLIETTATKFFEPEELKVFDQLPDDQRNTEIHESFVAAACLPDPPHSEPAWETLRDGWRDALNDKVFCGWTSEAEPLDTKQVFSVNRHGIHFEAVDFTSQGPIRLRLYAAYREGLERPDLTVLNVLDDQSWSEFLATMRVGFDEELQDESLPPPNDDDFKQTRDMFKNFKWAMAYVAPRGIGPTAWDQSPNKQTQHRRRFYLLGQTLDGMRVWDMRRAIQALRTVDAVKDSPLWLQSHRQMSGVALYASLYEPDIARLDLYELPTTHRDGPILYNVRRVFDMPQAVAMAAENSRVVIYQSGNDGWEFPFKTLASLGWDEKRLRTRLSGTADKHQER